MRTYHYCKHCWSRELCNLPGYFMSAWPLKTLVVNKEIQILGTPRAVTTRIWRTVKMPGFQLLDYCDYFIFYIGISCELFDLEQSAEYKWWTDYCGFYVLVLTSFVPYHGKQAWLPFGGMYSWFPKCVHFPTALCKTFWKAKFNFLTRTSYTSCLAKDVQVYY